jgi:hypothetical protein
MGAEARAEEAPEAGARVAVATEAVAREEGATEAEADAPALLPEPQAA